MTADLTTKLEMLILTGKLKPRERLVETELATKLNASRFLVRKAMQELVRRGLIHLIPNRGARVIDLSDEEVEDAFRLRLTLEFLVSEIAIKRITPKSLKEIQQIQAQYTKAVKRGVLEDMILKNEEFHNAFYHLTGNKLILEILGQVRNKTFFLRYNAYLISGRPQQSIDDHEAILQALRGRDLEKLKSVVSRSVLFPQRMYVEKHSNKDVSVYPSRSALRD